MRYNDFTVTELLNPQASCAYSHSAASLKWHGQTDGIKHDELGEF